MRKILLFIVSFLIIPLSVFGAEYDIKHIFIDANIKTNGDMEVSELIVLKGTFNGYERDLFYKSGAGNYNASNIENLSISAKNVGSVSFDTFNESFLQFNLTSSASNGDRGKFILTNYDEGLRARMYYKTDNKSTAFLIRYTLKDVGIMHADATEFYWNFLTNFEDRIEDLRIRVNFPSIIKQDNFNWWFHGPLTGNSSIINVNSAYTSILGKVKSVNAYESVDFRVLLPNSIFNSNEFSKIDNEYVKEDIINNEDDIVRSDIKKIKRDRTIFYSFIGASLFYYIFLIVMWIIVYQKYDKERKPKFNLEYNREFIDDYNVEVIDYLFHTSITSNAMSASIMNMIYKKNIDVEKMEGKDNYKFSLKNRDNLNNTENTLLDFLFNRVGSNNEFTTKDLKKYASSTKTCNEFMNSYTKWQRSVISDAKQEEFYDKLTGRFALGFITLFIACIITFIASVLNVSSILVTSLPIVSFIFIIYLCLIKRKSEKGIEHYAKWKAFKKFLEDFGTFKTKELPEIILWERYLVYATIFGLADKVEKAMNVKIKEIELSDGTYYHNNYVYVHNLHLSHVVNDSITSAYRGAQNTISRESVNASGGSFGGHGGGFSSGGGFGGGGGGGRGF